MGTDTLSLGPRESQGKNFGFALMRYIHEVASKQCPDLADLFPLTAPRFRLEEVHAESWVGFVITNDPTASMPSVGAARGARAEVLEATLSHSAGATVHAQRDALLEAGLWTPQQFACALLRVEDDAVSWPLVMALAIEWLNCSVLPDVLRKNESRVLRALPAAPRFDFASLAASLVVLEDDEQNTQGTAFFLEGIGLVTCSHVLVEGLKAFVARPPFTRVGLRVKRRHETIDLAVLETDTPLSDVIPLRRGDPNALRVLEPIAAVGFPGYCLGDTGTIMPGVVVGYRIKSSIRRLLTNATIVGGMSGGPVVTDSRTVIGVAVTGADRIDNIEETADRSVIPIDALDLLQ